MKRALLSLLVGCSAVSGAQESSSLVVASKMFPESYLLGEMMAQMLESEGFLVERKFGLGGTKVCYDALINEEIDIYAEYTGTLSQVILKSEVHLDRAAINDRLVDQGLTLLEPFGFNNSYAIVVRESVATTHRLETLSDLAAGPLLNFAFSHEFLEREDGWPGLQQTYGIRGTPAGVSHTLAYQAIATGQIDGTDGYTTDGEIARYQLRTLEDDKGFFPVYLPAPLVRIDMDPRAINALSRAAYSIGDAKMVKLNERVSHHDETFESVAAQHLISLGFSHEIEVETISEEVLRNTLKHLQLTGIALGAATVFAFGISLLVFRMAVLSKIVVYVSGLLQTIPSIALLAFMIPLFGIGEEPAIVALFLYSLLPIVRNTITSLLSVDPLLVRVATGMGLTIVNRLRYIYVPLALPSILAGIRTSAVICIGTATLAAFIGAGGLGEPIVEGLALNDTALILQGAIPAAALALCAELIFELAERLTTPRHLSVLEPQKTERSH